MGIAKRLWGDRWGLKRLLICWAAVVIPYLTVVALGGERGGTPGKQPFDRRACIDRENRYYWNRNPDLLEFPPDIIDAIAHQCAHEESVYYYGY